MRITVSIRRSQPTTNRHLEINSETDAGNYTPIPNAHKASISAKQLSATNHLSPSAFLTNIERPPRSIP